MDAALNHLVSEHLFVSFLFAGNGSISDFVRASRWMKPPIDAVAVMITSIEGEYFVRNLLLGY